MAENKPKTYYRTIARVENIIGVSCVVTLLADVARNLAEACHGGDGSEEWNQAFHMLRAFAVEIQTQLQE